MTARVVDEEMMMPEPLEVDADTRVVHTMRMRVVDAARALARRPEDRGALDDVAEALADYDAALAWYGVGAPERAGDRTQDDVRVRGGAVPEADTGQP